VENAPAWKRTLDIALIGVSAPVWGPVMLVIAAGIKLCSPGPIFFRQERIGLGAQPFTCLKFRSMHLNASTSDHEKYLAQLMTSQTPMKKLDAKGDKRLIKIGPLLRATGLDELPQLFNVLRGEMSLVGPRPCVRYEYENYSPAQKGRFYCLPGLTGLWQVSGKNNTSFSEMIRLDLQYLEHMSPWLDLRIMAKTIPALIRQVIETRVSKKKSR